MYCPKCGQQQVSDDMKFCSRCGLSIAGLSGWLANNEGLAGPAALRFVTSSAQRRGFTRGAKLMLASAVMTPIFLGMSLMVDEPIPLLVPFCVFLAGLSLLLYARIFGEDFSVNSKGGDRYAMGSTFGTNALPPAPDLRMNSVGRQQVRTSELVQPPSVTENTTKLLEVEKE